MFQNFEKVIESYGEEKTNELAAIINSACEILKISIPEILFNEHVAVGPDKIIGLDGYREKDYEKEANKLGFIPVLGSHTMDSDGNSVIMVALRDNEGRLLQLSHVLFTTLHELRHSWQYGCGYDKKFREYTEQEIIDIHKYLTHPLEIDAYAFGVMIMEQYTKYRPHLTISYLNRRFDKKRIKRTRELRKEFFPYVPKNQRTA